MATDVEETTLANRLTRIYTRTGDDGTTGLGSGERVAKDSLRVEAYGTVDELNCTIGVLLASAELPGDISEPLFSIQHRLFDLGGELSIPGRSVISAEHVQGLEQLLDRFNGELPALRDFLLPGGGPASAACHLARAVCRRAERRVWTLHHQEAVNPQSLRYLNRLSDLLFVLSRSLCRHEGGSEVIWESHR